MAIIIKNENAKGLVSVLYHSYNPRQRIVFFGVIRAIIAFASCIAILSIYETTSCPQIVLFGLIVFIILFFVSIFFIYAARSGNYRTIRLWLTLDITLTAIFVVLIIVLLCFAPSYKLIPLVVGIELMILSTYLCYKISARHVEFLNQPNQAQVFTNNEL